MSDYPEGHFRPDSNAAEDQVVALQREITDYKGRLYDALAHIGRLQSKPQITATEEQGALIERLVNGRAQQLGIIKVLRAELQASKDRNCDLQRQVQQRDTQIREQASRLFNAAVPSARADAYAGEWQPIETAPENGDRVELWVIGYSGMGRPEYARWSGHDWRYCGGVGAVYGAEITHWRPVDMTGPQT